MKKVVLYGAGVVSRIFFEEIRNKYEILNIIELDDNKIGQNFNGYKIHSFDVLKGMKFDEIIVCCGCGSDIIVNELKKYYNDESKFNLDYSMNLFKPRIKFLEQFSKIVYDKNMQGNVAEVGVFRGEFAEHINRVFPDRTLYLYDTFNGFDEKDIQGDEYVNKKSGAYFNNTSVELVLSKMKNPEKCVIRKGYFPDTAREDSEKFCFVSLDTDLYDPIKAGLEYFYPRMVGGGVILVDDYFCDTYPGTKVAVDEFCKKNNISIIPIGYEFGVAIIKN